MRISDWSSDVCSSDLFLDLDKALGADGQWLPFASQLVACYPGAFVEVSSSGAGLHIIGTGPATAPAHRNKPTPDVATQLAPLELEFYTQGRGIAFGLTQQATGCADRAFDFGRLGNSYFHPPTVVEAATGRSEESRGGNERGGK